ncbi:IclR family transcriptional regulator [Oxalobacteraceae bacterium OM1]|nr:IclR family transcriptional regulator [Oxalobacteraceae bacterium OM1]
MADELTADDAAKSNAKEDRHFVTALARGLEVLACFRSGDKLLGNQDLAERARLPKSTVSRLTYTLTKLGYLQYDDEAGKYRLGTATLALGSAMLSKLDIRQLARPDMQDLADFSHATVSLGMRDRLSMIYVENCRSQAALTLRLDVGARIPIALTAMGRAYLAETSTSERADILERVQEFDEQKWPSIRDGVQRALEEYQRLGVCTSFGEWQSDVNAIAVAFRPASGSSILSINCGGPAFNLAPEFLLDEVRPRLLEMVERLRRV